jgi:hypothetical protein
MMNKHIQAIRAGTVTKTNVIGIKKALHACERRRKGYSVSATAPKMTDAELTEICVELPRIRPLVAGELVETGRKQLRDKRYARRLESVADIIADPHLSFRLIRFDWLANGVAVPVYRADGAAGSFNFYNVPWQTAYAFGLESGPQIEEAGR